MKRFVGWVFASVLVGLVLAGVISSKPWLEFTPRLTGEMMSQMSKEDEAALLRCQKKDMYAENGKAWGKELFENAKTLVRVGMTDSPTVAQLLWNEYKYTCQRWGTGWSIQKLRTLS